MEDSYSFVDEYDVPVMKASSNGYYQEMLEIMKAMMSTSLKDNSSLCFAVVTGCLKIAKESIFTGTNNFVSDTITDSRLNEYFGFTQNDVNQILKESILPNIRMKLKPGMTVIISDALMYIARGM